MTFFFRRFICITLHNDFAMCYWHTNKSKMKLKIIDSYKKTCLILSRKFMGIPRCLISANTLICLKKTSIHNLYKRGKVMFRHDLMTFEEITILSSLSKTNFCTQSFIYQNLCQGVLKVHFY